MIVFHCPFPVASHMLFSANMARPVKMLSAFRQLGYQVEEITGYSKERREKIKRLKALVRNGQSIDFVYSESSNLPLFLNEANRLPLYPFLEYRFFQWLRKKGIPHGLFLRDLHWRFPHFNYPFYKRLPGVALYWLDWLMYMSRCSHLFLPGFGYKEHLPTKPHRLPISTLPPGCDVLRDAAASSDHIRLRSSAGLTMFYVGGVTPPLYDLTPMFLISKQLPEETIVMCCRPDEWAKAKPAYARHSSRNVKVVHAQGAELEAYYRNADLFLLAWNCYVYLDFAVPYKLFEAVANHLPIVALEGTESARLVSQEGFGWVAKGVPELAALIKRLRRAPELIKEKKKQLIAKAEKHSWLNRARSVAEVLAQHSPKQQEFCQP